MYPFFHTKYIYSTVHCNVYSIRTVPTACVYIFLTSANVISDPNKIFKYAQGTWKEYIFMTSKNSLYFATMKIHFFLKG